MDYLMSKGSIMLTNKKHFKIEFAININLPYLILENTYIKISIYIF